MLKTLKHWLGEKLGFAQQIKEQNIRISTLLHENVEISTKSHNLQIQLENKIHGLQKIIKDQANEIVKLRKNRPQFKVRKAKKGK